MHGMSDIQQRNTVRFLSLYRFSFFQWRCSPTRARASSFLMRFQDHTNHAPRQDSSGRVISPSQRPLPDNTQHSQQTNIHASGGIRTHDISRGAAPDLRLRQRGHWDRRIQNIKVYNLTKSLSASQAS